MSLGVIWKIIQVAFLYLLSITSVFSNSPLPNRAHHCPMYVAIYPIIILIISYVIFLWFSFKVYAPDMPNRLPVSDFVGGLVKNILRALKYWFHYTLVALAWLGVVPITACESRVLLNIILLLVSRGAKTVEPWHNKPLRNKVVNITNNFLYPSNSKI